MLRLESMSNEILLLICVEIVTGKQIIVGTVVVVGKKMSHIQAKK